MHPTDPTRIPALVAALQDAWEGQPDLTLPAFLGMLHNRGLSWGTSEEEMLELLLEVAREHPSLIDATRTHPTLLSTTAPPLAVTLSGNVAVVRSGDDPQRMPAVWEFSALRPTGPGRPLVLTDTEGVEHRLGVVTLATVFDPAAAPSLEGLAVGEIGGARWLVVFSDGRRAILGHRLRVWATEGRETRVETVAWVSVVACAPGSDMIVAPAGGRKPLGLGPVERVVLLEV